MISNCGRRDAPSGILIKETQCKKLISEMSSLKSYKIFFHAICTVFHTLYIRIMLIKLISHHRGNLFRVKKCFKSYLILFGTYYLLH